MQVTVTGVGVTFAKSWDVSNTLPPGITVKGATLVGNKWVINDSTAASGVLTISGAPTTPGTYTFTADAWQNTNLSGAETSGITAINVTGVAETAPAITTQPASTTVSAGSAVTLSVVATGSPAPSYQWAKNGTAIAGATQTSYSLPSAQTGDSGSYTVTLTNSLGTVTSQIATLTVNAATTAPAFSLQPVSHTVASGSTFLLSTAVTGAPTPTLQWNLDGVPVSGATSTSLLVSAATSANGGTYTCTATNAGGSVTSSPAVVTVATTSDPGRLVNISCRSEVGTGSNILIAGFVVGGQGTSGTENLLVRASGPALAAFGVTGTLLDPQLQIYSGSTLLLTNNGWQGYANISSAAAEVGAFPWTSAASHDSGIAKALGPGSYTAQVAGQTGDTGISLVEVYDVTPAGTYTPSTPRITNISARVSVGTGANVLIAGFVVGGSTAKTVLIRGSGPALTAFGVTGVIPDPQLQLFQSQSAGAPVLVGSNTGWGADPLIASEASAVGAFAWGTAPTADSAILATLDPGVYTAEISGAAGDTGISLVEIYDVP